MRKLNGWSPEIKKEMDLLVRWWKLAPPESRKAFKRAMPEMYRHLRGLGRI